MQIVFHIGAHETDADRLIWALRANPNILREAGTVVPRPKQYRRILQDAVNTLQGIQTTPETEVTILDAIQGNAEGDRLVLSNESFLCLPQRVLDDAKLYGRAYKSEWLRNIFPSAEVVFAIAMRDPASFVPALYRRLGESDDAFEDFLGGIDPHKLVWSDVLTRLTRAAPDARVITWCNEDTPLVWPEILRSVANIPPDAPIEGGYAPARELLTPEGQEQFDKAMSELNPRNHLGIKQVVAALLTHFAQEDALEEEIDLPGWTELLMEDLSRNYDADMAQVTALPGVTFISP